MSWAERALTQGRRRGAAQVVVVALCCLLTGCSAAPPTPKTAQATLTPYRALSATELAQSAAIVRHRLALVHATPNTVEPSAGGLTVTVPRAAADRITDVGDRDLLGLRLVLSESVATGAVCAPAGSDVDPIYRPSEPITACSADGTLTYQLGPVVLDSNDIVSARAVRDEISGTTKIYLTCTLAAGRRLADATGQHNHDQLAIEVDRVVIGTPVIDGPITGNSAEITGGYQTEEAEQLARLLSSEVLPVGFTLAWIANPPVSRGRTAGPGSR